MPPPPAKASAPARSSPTCSRPPASGTSPSYSAEPPSPASPPRSPARTGLSGSSTSQTFAALLVGTALGAGRGFSRFALYALVGMAGMPWFADGGSGTAAPSLGYILGMMVALAAVGALARQQHRPLVPAHRGHDAAGRGDHLRGRPPVPGRHRHVAERDPRSRVHPFLIGDALKAALAMGVLPTAWKFLNR